MPDRTENIKKAHQANLKDKTYNTGKRNEEQFSLAGIKQSLVDIPHAHAQAAAAQAADPASQRQGARARVEPDTIEAIL